MKTKRRIKQLCSVILVVTLIIGNFTSINATQLLQKETEETKNFLTEGIVVNDEKGTTNAILNSELDAFGFDTTIEPEGYDNSPNADNPVGLEVEIDDPVNELYIGNTSGSELRGHNDAYIGESLVSKDNTSQALKVETKGSSLLYDSYASIEGDFNGDGKTSQIVTVAGKIHSTDSATHTSTYSMDMYFTDPLSENGASNESVKHLILEADKRTSENLEDFSEMPAFLQNYLKITTGDYTGDGIDEIAVLVPGKTSSVIKIYQLQADEMAMDSWKIADNWEQISSKSIDSENKGPNMVSLVSGDLTGDKIDELCIAWGYMTIKERKQASGKELTAGAGSDHYSLVTYEVDPSKAVNSQACVLIGDQINSVQSNMFDEIEIDLADKDTETPNIENGIIRAGLAIGDADNDDIDELYVGGSIRNDSNYSHRVVRRLGYNAAREEEPFRSVASTYIECTGNYSSNLSTTNIEVTMLDGPMFNGYIYIDSLLVQEESEEFALKENLGINREYLPNSYYRHVTNYFAWVPDHHNTQSYYTEYDAVSKDLYGLGIETLIINQSFTHNNMSGTPEKYRIKTIDKKIASDKSLLVSDIAKSITPTLTSATPNTDEDSVKVTYTGEHYFEYKNPRILAVVLSPPYFSELAHLEGGDTYIGNSQTFFASTTSNGVGVTKSQSISAGAYANFETGAEFWGCGAKATGSIEIMAEVTKDWEDTLTLEKRVEYGTLGGQDTVAMISVPVEVFGYTITQPTSDGGTEVINSTINIPREPAVKTFSVADYDVIAKRSSNNLPILGEGNLKHTIGDPDSYPREKDLLGFILPSVEPGRFNSVGADPNGYIGNSLALTAESSFNIAGNVSSSVTVGAKGKCNLIVAGELEVGGKVEGSAGIGLVQTSSIGTEVGGSIMGMPKGAEELGYGYDWKVFSYIYPSGFFGLESFPVVSYLVDNVTRPPKLPTDFAADNELTTDSMIHLSWTKADEKVIGYQIFRSSPFPDGEHDIPVGDVIKAKDDKYWNEEREGYVYYIEDDQLDANTSYKYSIQSIGSTLPYKSVVSEQIIATTKLKEGYPVVTISTKQLQLLPDKTTNVSVEVSNGEVTAKETFYQWQKKVGIDWEDISYARTETLNFMNSMLSDEGMYRCQVSQLIGNSGVIAYSDVVNTSFDKYNLDINTSITYTGTNPELTINFTNRNNQSGSVPSGVADIIFTGNEIKTIEDVEIVNGSIYLSDWRNFRTGAYDVKIQYKGDDNFINKESIKTSLLIGVQEGYFLESVESLTYGEALETKVYKVKWTGTDFDRKLLEDGVNGVKVEKKLLKITIPSIYQNLIKVNTVINELHLITSRGEIFEAINNTYNFLWPFFNLNNTYNNPESVGNYYEVIKITEGSEISFLDNSLIVNARPITIEAKTARASSKDELDLIAGYDVIEGGFAYGDTFSSVGLSFEIDHKNNMDNPGKYKTSINKAGLNRNYKAEVIDGEYTITGKQYELELINEELYGAKVGEIKIISDNSNQAGYFYGENIVIAANPYPGYVVDQWIIDDVEVNDKKDIRVHGCSMGTNKKVIKVSFRVKGDRLSYSGINGEVKCVSSDILESDATVLKNAESSFVAMPDEGYHFKEWRLTQLKTEYPIGRVGEDGQHYLDFVMGDTSANIVAVFERDTYMLTLGDNLVASYLYDHDSDDGTDMIAKVVESGAMITGDTVVTIEAKAGYKVDATANWMINQKPYSLLEDDPNTVDVDETLYYNGLELSRPIVDAMTVEVATELQHYDINVSQMWSDSIDNPGGNSLKVFINGVETSMDQLVGVDGGSSIIITATPGYGSVFEQWMVNGAVPNALTQEVPTVYTCSALTSDMTVEGWFKGNESYNIEVNKDLHGSLSYKINEMSTITLDEANSSVKIFAGDTVTFLASPDQDFMVGQWIMDGTSYVMTEKSFTLEDIISAHKLEVFFTAMVYFGVEYSVVNNEFGTMTATMDDVIAITSGEGPIGGGKKISFTATPDTGKMVDYWLVNGEKVVNENASEFIGQTYVIKGLSEDVDVQVAFQDALTYNIDIEQPEHGITEGSYDHLPIVTPFTMREGVSMTFAVKADADYRVSSVLINGLDDFDRITVLEDGTWLCEVFSLSKDIKITAVIKEIFDITMTQVPGGTVNLSKMIAIEGEQVTISASSEGYYSFSKWDVSASDSTINVVIDGLNQSTTSFIMPDSDVVVVATYTYNRPSDPDPDPTPTPSPIVVDITDEILTEAGLFDADSVYDDLGEAEWARDEMEFLIGEGFVEGRGNNEFKPLEDITRSEFVAYLVNMTYSYDEEAVEEFDDVNSFDKYHQYIASAFDAELITGYSDTLFGPNDMITREDAVLVMVRILAKNMAITYGDFDSLTFLDKEKIAIYAREAIATSVDYEMIKGYDVKGGREFRPQNHMSRAEAVVVMYRLYKNYLVVEEEQ